MSYVAPLEDIRFLLRTVAPVADICSLPTFAHCDAELLFAVVEEGAKIARDVIAPLNAAADEPGARFENGNITTPPGFREAFTQLAADGWTSLAVPQDFGGQELPQLVNTIAAEMFAGACVAFQMALLTGSPAAKVIAAHGSDEQKTLWLPQIASGGAAATIVITEPQAGSDVGLIRTMATPQPDGAYAISGSKIFISQGDHDLTEQIVHLVLARTPGAAAGSRGLSLFLVPKRLPAAKGKPGARNSLRAARIEHKMGLSGSPTCEMVFEGATGTIIGHEGDGLRNLFAMMNAMRLDVAAQGVGVASAALRKAMAYVHERRQGAGRDGGPVAIVDHPDVRRNLLHMLAFTDGLRALLYMAAWHEDIATASGDRAVAKDAAAIVPESGPLFFDMLAAHLNPPWQILRIISAVMDKPNERYLSDSELSSFAERLMDAIDVSLKAITRMDLDGGGEAAIAAARAVELITQQTFELEVSIELSRDHGWGKRILDQKKTLANLVEARLKEAEKLVAAALPIQSDGFSRGRRSGPKLDAAPDGRAVGRALTVLKFVHDVRLCANYGGFSAMHAKVSDKLGQAIDAYVEDVLDHVRTGDVPDVSLAHDHLNVAADLIGLVRDDKATELVRRRAANACSTAKPAAGSGDSVVLDA